MTETLLVNILTHGLSVYSDKFRAITYNDTNELHVFIEHIELPYKSKDGMARYISGITFIYRQGYVFNRPDSVKPIFGSSAGFQFYIKNNTPFNESIINLMDDKYLYNLTIETVDGLLNSIITTLGDLGEST